MSEKFVPVKISDLPNNIGELVDGLRPQEIIKQVRIVFCSDARNHELRKAVQEAGYMTESNAGNAVLYDNGMPTIVVGHGNTDRSGCGAVDYAAGNPSDNESPFSAFVETSRGNNPIKNAIGQLSNLKSENQVGAIYFNQQNGNVAMVSNPTVLKASNLGIEALEIMKQAAAGISSEKCDEMSKYQNPGAMIFGNVTPSYNGVESFRVDVGRQGLHAIHPASLMYATTHSMQEGSPGFADTEFMVLGADINSGEILDFANNHLANKPFVNDYKGTVLLAPVGTANNKVYQLK